MSDNQGVASSRPALLPWIVAFKAVKATTLTAVGILLLASRHADPMDLLLKTALAVHLPFTSRVFARAVALVDNLTVAKETALAVTAFGYAGLMGAEGVALHLRKRWARWFTIVATSSLLPVELYEIAQEVHLMRILVFLANLAVIVYLVRRPEIFDA
jgi:uncharacterized membrane protein (DUF2068 family)